MANKQPTPADEPKVPSHGHELEAAVGALGALSGAGMGAIAGGPPGAIAGAIIGAVMGASSGWVAEETSAERAEVDRELDEEIGVTAGTVGDPKLSHPAPKTGLLSAEASGASSAADSVDTTEADGPIARPPA